MRIAFGIAATAVVVFFVGAFGLAGTWAVGTGAALLLVSAVVAAVAMEARDLDMAPISSPVRFR